MTAQTPQPRDALSLTSLIDSFLRGRGDAIYPNVVLSGSRLLAHGTHVATRLSGTEVWVTPEPLARNPGIVRGKVRREALLHGFRVYEGAKPPADDAFAPIPPVSREDAALVVQALRRLANGTALAGLPDPRAADRCRRLAAVYEAAAKGDRALASGLYGALPPTT